MVDKGRNVWGYAVKVWVRLEQYYILGSWLWHGLWWGRIRRQGEERVGFMLARLRLGVGAVETSSAKSL